MGTVSVVCSFVWTPVLGLVHACSEETLVRGGISQKALVCYLQNLRNGLFEFLYTKGKCMFTEHYHIWEGRVVQ